MVFHGNFGMIAAKGCGSERNSGWRVASKVGGLVVASLVSIACGTDASAPTVVTPNVTDAGGDGAARGPFVAPADPGKGGFLVTVSGEDLAVGGYEWSPSSKADGDPPAFVDGWAVSFRHVLLTVDRLRLNEDPDRDPGDATALGAEVASVAGPFAVDLSVGGNITGKSGSPDEKTVAIAALGSRKDGRPFDPAARYAFSYDLATASASAQRVNLDAEGAALYEQAIAKGWAMVFDGVATYKGPAPAAGSAFAELPQEVRFTLGFNNPASYINCENTDLQSVGEGFPRGLQANANKSTVAQITFHTDHLFWNKLQVEGTPLHFDALAAQAEVDPSTPTKGRLTIEALENVDITNVRTRGGAALPWRSLVSDYTAPAGTVRYDSAGIAFTKTNSLASFLTYSASGGGHLNADGECAIRRNYTP